MNFFGIGIPEIAVIICCFSIINFWTQTFPELGKNIGKTLKDIQSAFKEFYNEKIKL